MAPQIATATIMCGMLIAATATIGAGNSVADSLWMWGTPSGFKQVWAKYLTEPVGTRRTRITAVARVMIVHSTFLH